MPLAILLMIVCVYPSPVVNRSHRYCGTAPGWFPLNFCSSCIGQATV